MLSDKFCESINGRNNSLINKPNGKNNEIKKEKSIEKSKEKSREKKNNKYIILKKKIMKNNQLLGWIIVQLKKKIIKIK